MEKAVVFFIGQGCAIVEKTPEIELPPSLNPVIQKMIEIEEDPYQQAGNRSFYGFRKNVDNRTNSEGDDRVVSGAHADFPKALEEDGADLLRADRM